MYASECDASMCACVYVRLLMFARSSPHLRALAHERRIAKAKLRGARAAHEEEEEDERQTERCHGRDVARLSISKAKVTQGAGAA